MLTIRWQVVRRLLVVVGDSTSLSDPVRLSAAGARGWLSAAAFVFALHWLSAVQELLPAMDAPDHRPRKKARLQQAFTTIALKSTCQVGKLLGALDPQELADMSGTGLKHCSLKQKLSHT